MSGQKSKTYCPKKKQKWIKFHENKFDIICNVIHDGKYTNSLRIAISNRMNIII